MKLRMPLILSVLAFIAIGAVQAEEKVKLLEQKPTISEKEYLYEIKDDEVMVNDKLITLFALSENGLSASYRNKTKEEKKPEYTIEVYNAYGLLIGEKEVGGSILLFGNSTYMEPGEVSAEKIHLDEYPITEILINSNIQLPDDLMKMKWIVLSKTNTK